MFKKITDNVEIHQTLPDTPNLTTQELKKTWDKGCRIIKEAFNNLVDMLNDAKITSKILYNDTTGTAEDITFNEEIKQGDYIEILYCRRKVSDGTSIIKTTGKLPFTNGMMTNLDINYFSFPENQQSISKSVTINGNGIKVNGENTWGNVIGFESTNTIFILNVKKYGE